MMDLRLARWWRCLNYYDYDLSWWSTDGDGPRVPRAEYAGTVAQAPLQTIRQRALLSEFPHLKVNFQWIDPTFLQALIPESQGPGNRNGKLEILGKQLQEGLIAEAAPRQRTQGLTLYHSAFTVPKKKPGELRFILSCVILNKMLQGVPIPPCQFPEYREIVSRILSQPGFSQFDFKSYFFQFELDESIRDIFRFRVGSRHLRMLRLPMGYKASPQLGQSVTEALTAAANRSYGERVNTVVWLDNIIFAGPESLISEVGLRFSALCSHFGVSIGDTCPAAARGEALGLQFDCSQKRWRMDPSWVSKINEARKTIPLEQNLPLKVWWRLGGIILWRCHALQEPLFCLEILLRWMSEVCRGAEPEDMKKLSFWNRAIRPSAEVRQFIARQLDVIGANTWKQWAPPPTRVVEAHTDASLTAWACEGLHSRERTCWGHFPVSLRQDTIDVKEMFALVEFIIQECDRAEVPILLKIGVDNTSAIGAWKKAFSYNATTLSLIMLAHRAMAQKGVVVSVYYVPTDLNKADQCTGIKEPDPLSTPPPLLNLVEQLRFA